MAPRLICVAGLLAVVLAAESRPADTILLIDRSGSLRPYYQSGEVRSLARRLAAACESTGRLDLAVFDTEFTPITSLDSPDFAERGRDTQLHGALLQARGKYAQIWLLTDNVQDVAGDKDMTRFYEALKEHGIRHVYVFPLLHQPPPEAPGLLIYAISTRDDSSRLQKQIAAFRQTTGDLQQLSELLMKPLGENSIEVEVLGQPKPLKFAEGSALRIEDNIRIRAKFPHLYFETSPAQGGQAASPFVGDSCLVAEKNDSEIFPRSVQTQNAAEYRVKADFGRVHLKTTLPCIWQAGFQRSRESGEIETPIIIRVPQRNLRLSPAFLRRFTAADEQEARQTGKIAGLQHLPEFLAPQETIVPIRIPHQVTVTYPPWPAIFLTLAGTALAGLVGLLIYLAVKSLPARRQLYAEDEQGRPLPAELRGNQVIVSGRQVGRLASGSFVPVGGTKLEPEAPLAAIRGPLLCVLPDGNRIRLFFEGHRAQAARAGAGAGTPSAPGPRPPVKLIKR
jgi:hypothetical protein